MAVLVGKKAPLFKAKAVVNGGEIINDFSLEQFIGKKYVIFIFYPLDFTFVCPTELIAFQERIAEFESRNCAVVACSVDSHQSHWAWLQTEQKAGGIKGVMYPIVSDLAKTISRNYDVLAGYYSMNEDGEEIFEGVPEAYRGLFLIDMKGTVRHQVVNDMPLGRSVDETIRMLDALQFNEENGEVCPIDWKPGKKALSETHESIAEFLGSKK